MIPDFENLKTKNGRLFKGHHPVIRMSVFQLFLYDKIYFKLDFSY